MGDEARKTSRGIAARKDSEPILPGGTKESANVEPAPGADARDTESGPLFTRLTLMDAAGQGWVFQGDGQVLRIAGGREEYVKTLGKQDLELIGRALAAAGTDQWRGGGAGPRMVLEMKSIRRVVGLPSGKAAVEALVALLRSLVA
jgi:hypothetical protein